MYTVKGKSNKDHLLTEHIPLVKRLAHHMKAKLPPSVEVDDLIQAGMIGLLDAITRYEETHGAQFETYAVLRIRGAMLDELRTSDWLPRSMRQNMRKIEEAMSTLQQRLGHPPTESEVAKLLKISLVDYQEMLGEGGGHQLVYYEDFHDPDGNDSFLDRHCVDEDSDPLRSLLDTDFRQSVIDAISRYEETHGAQFETYAVLRIRGAMLDELRTSDWLPRSMRQNMRKIEEAMSILQQHGAEGADNDDGKGGRLQQGGHLAAFQCLADQEARQRQRQPDYAGPVHASSLKVARRRATAWVCSCETRDSDTPITAPISFRFSSSS